MTTFSIIIPVYNVAPYLRECLDSVRAQTFTDWECVCVDDGSTDGSGAILDEYAAIDPRFKVIHQTNAGVSVARNHALDTMEGTYFTFVDGDDAIVPDTLECFTDVFSKTSADALLCWPTSNLANISDILLEPRGYKVLLAQTTPLSILAGRYTANGYPFLRGYKASLFRNVRFQQGLTVMEDARYQADCLCIAAVWTIIEKRYYAYRRERPGSATKTNTPNHFIRWVEAFAYTMGRMRNAMGASDKDVRTFAKVWGPVYRSRAVHPAFRIWKNFSRNERQEWWSVLKKCCDACGFWPFRWTDRIRLVVWQLRLDTILFPPLFLIDRIPNSIQWRWRRLRAFLSGNNKLP